MCVVEISSLVLQPLSVWPVEATGRWWGCRGGASCSGKHGPQKVPQQRYTIISVGPDHDAVDEDMVGGDNLFSNVIVNSPSGHCRKALQWAGAQASQVTRHCTDLRLLEVGQKE